MILSQISSLAVAFRDYEALIQSLRDEQKRLFDDVVRYLEKVKMDELRKKFE